MRTVLSIIQLYGLLLLLATVASAAEGDTLWTRTYGGEIYEVAYSVIQTTEGGYLLTGMTTSFGPGTQNIYLVKTTAGGDTLWTRAYGWEPNGIYIAHDVLQTNEGDYLLAGEILSAADGLDMYLMKINSLGDTLWTRTFGGNHDEVALSLLQTTEGNYLMAGWTETYGPLGANMYLVKINAAGDTLWTRTYGGIWTDAATSIIQTSDGDYVLAGNTEHLGIDLDLYLVKTDSSGDTLWTHTYGGSQWDAANSVVQTLDGGYLLAGGTWSFSPGDEDLYLVKTDSLGDTLWTRTYGGVFNEAATSVLQTEGGDYLVAGTITDLSQNSGMLLLKTNSSGDMLWLNYYGGSNSSAYSLMQDSAGNYLLAAETWLYGAGMADMFLVCVEGLPATVVPNDPVQPLRLALYPPHPNPFNLSTVARFELRVPSNVSFRIYETTGQLVATLVEGWREAGAHQVTFDGSGLPSGVYIYHLEMGGVAESGKMILLK